MKYLKSITIENFENHKYTFIELNPGFNIFTGRSSSGKSSCIRAIRWLCFNEPSGDKFIRKETDKIEKIEGKYQKSISARVLAEISDGFKVERMRNSNGKSKYIIYDPNKTEPIEFSKFGNDVPIEVREVLGFGYIKSGKSKFEVNYLSQFEPPRALTQQGNSLSNIINKLNRIEDFEIALSEINSKIHQRGELSVKEKITFDRLKLSSDELEELKDNSSKINFLNEEIVPILKNLIQLEENIKNAEVVINTFEKIKSSYMNIKQQIKDLPNIKNIQEHIDKNEYILEKILYAQSIVKNIENLDNKILNISKKIDNDKILSDIDLKQIDIRMNNLLIYTKNHNEAKQLSKNIENFQESIDKNINLITLNQKKYEDVMYDIIGEKVCFLCQQELDEDATKAAKNYLCSGDHI